MATSSDIHCAVCEYQSITTPAVKWCPECDETFCTECMKHHSIAKATRDHDVIKIENYERLPRYILEIKQNCEIHGARFQNFCRNHDKPCCKKCIDTTHKGCKDLPSLDDVIANSKFSVSMEENKNRLIYLKQYLSSLIQEKKENIECIKQKRREIEHDIEDFRTKINMNIDTLEKDLQDQLSCTKTHVTEQIEGCVKELMNTETRIQEMMTGVISIEQYASNLQCFLGIKTIEHDVLKEEAKIEKIGNTNNIETIEISIKINDQLKNVLNGVNKFGEIEKKTQPSRHIYKKAANKQAQIPSVRQNPQMIYHGANGRMSWTPHIPLVFPHPQMSGLPPTVYSRHPDREEGQSGALSFSVTPSRTYLNKSGASVKDVRYGDDLDPPLQPLHASALLKRCQSANITSVISETERENILPSVPTVQDIRTDRFEETFDKGIIRICPVCSSTFSADITQVNFEEHVLGHVGKICPLCYNLVDNCTDEEFQRHVNQHLDQRNTERPENFKKRLN